MKLVSGVLRALKQLAELWDDFLILCNMLIHVTPTTQRIKIEKQ